MYEYTRKVRLKTNLSAIVADEHPLTDLDVFFHEIYQSNITRSFKLADSDYTLHTYFSKFPSNSSTSLLLNLELYDGDYNEIPLYDGVTKFNSEYEYYNFIRQSIERLINELNSQQFKIKYFTNNDSLFYMQGSRLYMAVYDFKTEQYMEPPTIKEIVVIFEEPNLDSLLESLNR